MTQGMSKRIQRKRTRGWRMPANAKYCGRPSKWGNPYGIDSQGQFTREQAIEAYQHYVERVLISESSFLDELKGKDLACWCPLKDKNGNAVPCHADVLLKMLAAMP